MSGGQDRILIAGDSFSSDFNSSYEWWKKIPYQIINVSQPGSSEFKILKSLETNLNNNISIVIIFHTNFNRIYTEKNLLHIESNSHKKSCYVIADVIDKKTEISTAMSYYIKYFYNEKFVLWTHKKICSEIENITNEFLTIHCSGFDYTNIYKFNNFISANDLFIKYKGNTCHLTEHGNQLLADRICQHIKKLLV